MLIASRADEILNKIVDVSRGDVHSMPKVIANIDNTVKLAACPSDIETRGDQSVETIASPTKSTNGNIQRITFLLCGTFLKMMSKHPNSPKQLARAATLATAIGSNDPNVGWSRPGTEKVTNISSQQQASATRRHLRRVRESANIGLVMSSCGVVNRRFQTQRWRLGGGVSEPSRTSLRVLQPTLRRCPKETL